MRILVIGAGGVGSAVAAIARRRDFFERMVLADLDGGRAQAAVNPVAALELLAEGVWSGAGVLGPEAFDAVPFLGKLAELGAPHGVDERDPADPLRCKRSISLPVVGGAAALR